MREPLQQQLRVGEAAKPVSWVDDFRGALPHGVLPTRVGVLEAGDSLLFIKNYQHGDAPSRGQRKLFHRMVRFGTHEDAPGSVAVWCVWGNQHTERQLMTFDHMGISEAVFLSTQELRARITSWWNANSDRR